MCCKKLEEFYPKDINDLLTCDYRIIDINKFSKIKNPQTIDSLEKKFTQLDFTKLDFNGCLEKEYSYSCQDEEFIELIRDKNCNNCGEKIISHEDYVELVKMNEEIKKQIKDRNEYILKEIVGDYFPVLESLKIHFADIIPFLGAGISVPVGMPSWPNIIKEMSKGNKRIDRINDHLRQGEYLDCFPILLESSPIYKNRSDLKKHFSQIFWKNNYIFKDSNHIDFLENDFPLIVTTNYDCILEQVDKRGYMSENFLNITDLQDLKRNKVIIHLHGQSKPLMKDTMIIDKDDYDTIYNDDTQKRRLQTLLGTQKILFFGYSLDDYYFINELAKINESNNSYNEYYAIMINQSIEKLEGKSPLLRQIKYINLDIKQSVTETKEGGFEREILRSSEDINHEIIIKIRFLLYYLRNKLYVS